MVLLQFVILLIRPMISQQFTALHSMLERESDMYTFRLPLMVSPCHWHFIDMKRAERCATASCV